jgi:inhibitor of Bruton tyrosine kinase
MLSDASHFQVKPLMYALHDYMAANMETLLEGRMLDDLTPGLMKQLTQFVHDKQAEKFPVTRSTRMFDRAMQSHAEWLALQDIPYPVVRTTMRPGPPKESPKHSPPRPSRKHRRLSITGSPLNSPVIRPLATIQQPPSPVSGPSGPSGDEVFLMDEPEVSHAHLNEAPAGKGAEFLGSNIPSKPVPVWSRKSSTPKYMICFFIVISLLITTTLGRT